MNKLFEIESFADFQEELQGILNSSNKEEKNTQLKLYERQNALDDIQKLVSNCNFDLNEVHSTCNSKEWPEDRVNCFMDFLERNKTEFLYYSINNHNSNYGETLINFDWISKYIFGTSELKTSNYLLLQLLFTTINNTGIKSKTVYDVDKEILQKIISILENMIQ